MAKSKKAKAKKVNPRKRLAKAVGEEDAVAHLTLSWRSSPGVYQVRYVETDDSVAAEFLGFAQGTAEDLATNRGAVEYNPEWPLREHEYFALTEEEIPGGNLFDMLENFLDLERFEKAALRKPSLYTLAVQTKDGTALFGKRAAYLKQLGKKRGSFAAVWDGSTFSELEDTVVGFATDFDWILWRDVLYVLNGKSFNAEFRDQLALMAAVQEHVEAIEEKIAIVGADEFVKRCQSTLSMASKLQNIAENGIWDKPISELKQYALEREIAVEWDGDALVFDGSLEHQFAILKLLDEDRTHGPVSGRTYDSAAKQAVELGKKKKKS
ncbi:MAG TPA: Kiwa anti-phage protein KwaB-like domain-containing protein [Solirubrobacterales bacterium]|nr:Kiwa anti-phage protein KwaB-like domain-containing protein [Solirubrobacterales bacterium]